MKRRAGAWVMALALALLAPPFPGEAQQAARTSRLGYLSSHRPEAFRIDVLRSALRELGWVEGRNLVIDHRSADGRLDRLPALAAELVGLKPDVIVAVPTVAALAAMRTTQEIPIVFTHVSDPVGAGLVHSLARPTANVTGVTHLNASLNPKRLEILSQAVPGATLVAAIWQPGGLGQHTERLMLTQTEAAASALGVGLRLIEARGSRTWTVPWRRPFVHAPAPCSCSRARSSSATPAVPSRSRRGPGCRRCTSRGSSPRPVD